MKLLRVLLRKLSGQRAEAPRRPREDPAVSLSDERVLRG
jgi:hypothetical protein